MGSYNPIEIQIRWKCPHCGHTYEQGLNVCMPQSSGQEPKMLGAGALICQHCGQMGPMQVGCALLLGLSVMAGSDGAVHLPRSSAVEECKPDSWALRLRHPSRN